MGSSSVNSRTEAEMRGVRKQKDKAKKRNCWIVSLERVATLSMSNAMDLHEIDVPFPSSSEKYVEEVETASWRICVGMQGL